MCTIEYEYIDDVGDLKITTDLRIAIAHDKNQYFILNNKNIKKEQNIFKALQFSEKCWYAACSININSLVYNDGDVFYIEYSFRSVLEKIINRKISSNEELVSRFFQENAWFWRIISVTEKLRAQFLIFNPNLREGALTYKITPQNLADFCLI